MNGKILNKEALKAWILSKMVTLTNNLIATTPGISAMDAAQGPVIQGQIDAINSNLTRMTDNDAIKGLEAREDGVYITYVPAAGADPVSKKLGNLHFNLATNVRIFYYSDNGIRNYVSAGINYTYKNGSLSHTVSSNNECSVSKTITIS